MIAVRDKDGMLAWFQPGQIVQITHWGDLIQVKMSSSWEIVFELEVWRRAVKIFSPLIWNP